MTKFLLIFKEFEEVHLGKDVFLVPLYIKSMCNYDVTIIFPKTRTNQNIPLEYRGVHLRPMECLYNKTLFDIMIMIYLFFCSKKINILMLFHLSKGTLRCGNIYKYMNKKGILYVKCDGAMWFYNWIKTANIKRSFLKMYTLLVKKLLSVVDCISCETTIDFDKIKKGDFWGIDLSEKLVLMPNGFDELLAINQNIIEKEFKDKTNTIVTVGNIGTHVKNTKMLLDALSIVDLKDWKVYIIGPIEPSFMSIIKEFYSKNKHLRNKVMFTGNIRDKKQLWSYYNDSKIFILTSLGESFGLVLVEALRFGNYLISTDVGAIRDCLSLSNNYGSVVGQNDVIGLSEVLQYSINSDLCKESSKYNRSFVRNKLSWTSCIEALKSRI